MKKEKQRSPKAEVDPMSYAILMLPTHIGWESFWDFPMPFIFYIFFKVFGFAFFG